eukprot:7461651-Pyramimonas_sp.AAC.2
MEDDELRREPIGAPKQHVGTVVRKPRNDGAGGTPRRDGGTKDSSHYRATLLTKPKTLTQVRGMRYATCVHCFESSKRSARGYHSLVPLVRCPSTLSHPQCHG